MTPEQLWCATNDHIRDLMEMVEGQLVEPIGQRRWRLAMSAFARRAAHHTGLPVPPEVFDRIEARIDGLVVGVDDTAAFTRVVSEGVHERPLLPSEFADIAVCAVGRAVDASGNRLFDALYWQQAEFASEDPQAECVVQAAIFKDIFGNPFRPVAFSPAWRSKSAVALARTAYDTRNFSLLPILADALEEAGCEHPDVLTHCRDPRQVHVRGCWVVDLVLNKS